MVSAVFAVVVGDPADLQQLLPVIYLAVFHGFHENMIDLQASDCRECPAQAFGAFPDAKQFQPKI